MHDMENGLEKKKKQQLASLIGNHDLGDLIQPLKREIYLFDTRIAGTTHLADQTVLDVVKVDDELTLRREPDNAYDEMAILIFYKDGRKLGYIPRVHNLVFARLMDGGKMLTAKIYNIEERHNFKNIEIKLYLVDF